MTDGWVRVVAALLYRWGRLSEKARSSYWSKWIGRQHGRVGSGLRIRKGVSFSISESARLEIGRDVVLAEGAAIFVGSSGKLTLGDGVFIGRGSVIVANQEVVIGQGTQIAHSVTVIDSDHRFGREDLPLVDQGGVSSPVRIGAEVWIGAQAVILRGRTLGDRCVVGAGAVVARDVPAHARAVGNPARILDPVSS